MQSFQDILTYNVVTVDFSTIDLHQMIAFH
jgi:hypothetical protein